MPGEGEVRRAALARVTVENRTAHTLDIAFRAVADPGLEVVVGRVAGQDSTTVAPVLAGEPITLVARTECGTEFLLPARTFEVDAEWVWVIPEDAPFGTRTDRGRGNE